jgi:pantothenate kinase
VTSGSRVEPVGSRVVEAATAAELSSLIADELSMLRARSADQRIMVGLAGCPGVGKSTVSELLRTQLGPVAQVIAMDGFHLSNAALVSLGRADRKGAADTFDRDGFATLLHRLRADDHDQTVWVPVFHREIEESIAAERGVAPQHRTVIVEGNYLLLWPECAGLLDACWYLEAVDDAARVSRLVSRHVSFGRTLAEATQWVQRSDEANARIIESARSRADLVIRYPNW